MWQFKEKTITATKTFKAHIFRCWHIKYCYCFCHCFSDFLWENSCSWLYLVPVVLSLFALLCLDIPFALLCNIDFYDKHGCVLFSCIQILIKIQGREDKHFWWFDWRNSVLKFVLGNRELCIGTNLLNPWWIVKKIQTLNDCKF